MRRRLPILLLLIALAAPAAAQAPDMRQLEREIERLRGELVELGAAEQAGEGAAGVQRGRLVELNVRERALKAKIDANRGDLARLLGALQTYQRRPPPPLLVNPRSARDAVRAAILIRAITPRLEARGRAFAVQAEEIAKLRRTAAAASETLFQAESDIADRRAEIERLTTEKSGLERQLYADAGLADPETRALAARAGSVADFVERLDRGKRAAPRNPPAKLLAPVQGTLARRFGDAQEGRERSQGWTWRAPPNAPVLSPAAAQVDYAGPLKGWGLVLILNIGGDRRLVLAGLDEATAGVGRTVAAGEPVGRMGPGGEGGRVPPELYLEVRDGSGALDPGRWLTAVAQKQTTDGLRR
jgi:septal ring factor EnvC (AmiA/AmiB activator)